MHGCWSETRFVVRQSRDTDWETAFSDDTEFIKPPIEAESDSRYVWKLRKALNGLKKASQLFSNYLSDILVDKLGFEKCPLVPFTSTTR